MRQALLFPAALFVVAACSSNGGAQPCTLLAIGKQCINDTDCCTGYCDLEGDVAACQELPGSYPACQEAGSFCTQNRNCCSGFCDNSACVAETASCLSIGSTCIQSDSCCSDNCIGDGNGGTACAPQPVSDSGPGCGLPGTPCSTPGDDPGECCFGLCGPNSLCAGGGGGGGGGGNCGAAGAFCRYGSDCCSGECEQLSSTSACH